jgi:hypothetical protein
LSVIKALLASNAAENLQGLTTFRRRRKSAFSNSGRINLHDLTQYGYQILAKSFLTRLIHSSCKAAPTINLSLSPKQS